jgi:hypothetical protein
LTVTGLSPTEYIILSSSLEGNGDWVSFIPDRPAFEASSVMYPKLGSRNPTGGILTIAGSWPHLREEQRTSNQQIQV